jgi:hypothetical protein
LRSVQEDDWVSTRTPTTEQLIRPIDEGFPGWEEIAKELAFEVTRLRSEIDRLKGGGKAPLHSHADWTHPLYPLWIEMGLDDNAKLEAAWNAVFADRCPKCEGTLEDGPYDPFKQCADDGLCFIVGDGHFAIDTLERAQERGPDS